MNTMIIISQGLIFAPIVISILIYLFNKKIINYLVFPIQFALTTMVIKLWFLLEEHGPFTYVLGGYNQRIAVELKMDHLSLLFMMMAVLMWWSVIIYAWNHKGKDFKFLFFLMFLEGSFMAFLQVNDFFTFFVLLELITIISAILILYKKDGISVKAGLYYLLFNSLGMVIYFFGIMLLYFKTGTLNMTISQSIIEQSFISSHSFSILHVSFATIFIAMCIKAALFPVYEWLPRAHTAAPAYISALLSGLLVKTGIYGLLRILPIFNVFDVSDFLFYLGFFTALSGIIFAVSQKDIKGILAFHTISQIGLIIMSLAYGSEIGYIGAYLHLFNHFLFKSILFFGAGLIINNYGYRRVTEIHGIFKTHPFLSIMMIIAILSITGAPFFIGFISKSMMKYSGINYFHQILFQLIGLGTVISFIKFSTIFIGKKQKKNPLDIGGIIGIGFLTSITVMSFFFELSWSKTLLKIGRISWDYGLAKGYDKIQHSMFTISSVAEFSIMAMLAYIIFKLIIKPEAKFYHTIRHFRVKFQDAVIYLLIFLAAVLNYI
ncbi:MAG: hypothetical protein JXR88_05290 [Clostridia bacterium]|nr:hypothetical protein [Clostridia bacterium]